MPDREGLTQDKRRDELHNKINKEIAGLRGCKLTLEDCSYHKCHSFFDCGKHCEWVLAREKKMLEQIEELKEKAWKYDQLSK